MKQRAASRRSVTDLKNRQSVLAIRIKELESAMGHAQRQIRTLTELLGQVHKEVHQATTAAPSQMEAPTVPGIPADVTDYSELAEEMTAGL